MKSLLKINKSSKKKKEDLGIDITKELNEFKVNTPLDLKNHIDEYFQSNQSSKEVITSKELFTADKDVDIKTELDIREITLINKLEFNNLLLEKAGLSPVYRSVITGFERLKISNERKSRAEFVDMNKNASDENLIKKASGLNNIASAKK